MSSGFWETHPCFILILRELSDKSQDISWPRWWKFTRDSIYLSKPWPTHLFRYWVNCKLSRSCKRASVCRRKCVITSYLYFLGLSGLSGRNCLRGSAACSRKGGPSVSGKKIIRENASVNAFLAGPEKNRVHFWILWEVDRTEYILSSENEMHRRG